MNDYKRYEDGNFTEYAENVIFELEYQDDDLPGRDYLASLSEINNFYEYTEKNARTIGYEGNSKTELIDFLQKKCDKTGIYFSKVPEENKKTLKRWLEKGNPPSGDNGRENVYKLCFVLQMDTNATIEFFLKGFLERPFDYKDIHEATYFFCMKNRLGYNDALSIIKEINSSRVEELYDADEVTEVIGNEIAKKKSRAEFVAYMSENCWEKKQTASNAVMQLIEDCKILAEEEHQRFTGEKIEVKTVEDLLYVIYGYRARLEEDGKKVYATSIAKSRLPEHIRANFPQLQQFRNIEKGVASYDAIRKAFIMLYFYKFFAVVRINKKQPLSSKQSIELFNEFIDSLDAVLNKCGYVQHYWRNPYDWMFGYCADQDEPLDEFRGIIEEFYLSDFE